MKAVNGSKFFSVCVCYQDQGQVSVPLIGGSPEFVQLQVAAFI